MLPYVPDWNKTSTANGYVVVRCEGHPKAWKNRGHYVYAQVVVAEQKLGRLLTDDEIAHHKDENKRNNNPENIVVVSNRAEHARMHARPPTIVTLQCSLCGNDFPRRKRATSLAQRKGDVPVFCSRKCSNERTQFKHRPEFKHGTLTSYNYRGCRCDLCKAVKQEYYARYKLRRKARTSS